MISFPCPGCGSKLNAPDALAGHSRNCPKCKAAVVVPAGPEAAASPAETARPAESVPPPAPAPASIPTHQTVGSGEHPAAGPDTVPLGHWPRRLARHNHYLVCDHTRLVATWENNGRGWLLRTNSGMISAARNAHQIPSEGDFTLVELVMEPAVGGLRLQRLVAYHLARRHALTHIEKSEDKLLQTIVGMGSLNKDQKNAVRAMIKTRFMREVWEKSEAVMDYLGNTDYHSPGA
jgi:hypothetical protein